MGDSIRKGGFPAGSIPNMDATSKAFFVDFLFDKWPPTFDRQGSFRPNVPNRNIRSKITQPILASLETC